MNLSSKSLSQSLINWYRQHQRNLPWRIDRDPYRIWISEVMLQQTTVAAVVPFYEKFMLKFPTVKKLAAAPLDDVYSYWAGLGYYSRARNLHKAAQLLAKSGFPNSAAELLELPGFGPYTSRAVASLAFSEPVGVLDGNVIRVLSRVHGKALDWWTRQGRDVLQNLSDQMAKEGPSNEINQGLMELGATICTPRKPACLLCPWKKSCVALSKDLIDSLPNKKIRRQSEVWVWDIDLLEQKAVKKNPVGVDSKFVFIKNNYAPFLKGTYIFPGTIQKENKKPKSFALKHAITHHDIYIQIRHKKISLNDLGDLHVKCLAQWFSSSEIKKVNPSSVLQKVLLAQSRFSQSVAVMAPQLKAIVPKAQKNRTKKPTKTTSKL